jgi:nucleotide-binding universal stress UspA family protein
MSTAPSSSILVPLDGSVLAEQALWVAARLARRLHGVLHLVTVRGPTPTAGDETGEPAARADSGREIRHDLREYLEGKAEELATAHGVCSSCGVLRGWPPDALADYVRVNGIALVVMTAHGRSGVSRCWIDSVTDGLLARVCASVLVLRPGIAATTARFQRILVALDGSAGSKKVLAQAVALDSVELGTEYTLVEVVEPPMPVPHHPPAHPGPDPADSLVRRREAAVQDLERLAERLRKRGLAVTTRVLVGQRVAEQLITLAQSLGSDLIAVGTQRPRATERLLLGSVADKVVRGASQPVLVIQVRKRLTHAAGPASPIVIGPGLPRPPAHPARRLPAGRAAWRP